VPKYIKFEDVRQRVIGKVKFQDPAALADENKMSIALATRLIDEAEAQVEMDLSPRYASPFSSKSKPTMGFLGLDPKGVTRNVIRTLCEIQAVMRILETDFGSGSAVDASKYIATIEKRYTKMLETNVLGRFDDKYKDSRQWKQPPLPDLQLAQHNTEADDGFAGMVTVTDRGEGLYPVEQIDDPSQTWFNATFDEDH
jgi:hypothetical protein